MSSISLRGNVAVGIPQDCSEMSFPRDLTSEQCNGLHKAPDDVQLVSFEVWSAG